jgi:hypothetical protein
MDNSAHHITHVDRREEGLLLYFKDGRVAFYSDEMLYAFFYLAKRESQLSEDKWH